VPAVLASTGCYRFHLDLKRLDLLAHYFIGWLALIVTSIIYRRLRAYAHPVAREGAYGNVSALHLPIRPVGL